MLSQSYNYIHYMYIKNLMACILPVVENSWFGTLLFSESLILHKLNRRRYIRIIGAWHNVGTRDNVKNSILMNHLSWRPCSEMWHKIDSTIYHVDHTRGSGILCYAVVILPVVRLFVRSTYPNRTRCFTDIETMASIQPRDSGLDYSNRCEIW